MANTNNPFGFIPTGVNMSGALPRMKKFLKAVGYATAIFPGDLVNAVADGSIEKSITPGTTLISGVAANFGAASAATEHMVYFDPGTLFIAQDDGSGSGTLDVDYGLLANAVLTAGDATLQKSKHQIDTSTKAVTATLDVKLLEPLNAPDNEAGANRRSIVLINKHRMTAGVVGI